MAQYWLKKLELTNRKQYIKHVNYFLKIHIFKRSQKGQGFAFLFLLKQVGYKNKNGVDFRHLT